LTAKAYAHRCLYVDWTKNSVAITLGCFEPKGLITTLYVTYHRRMVVYSSVHVRQVCNPEKGTLFAYATNTTREQG
jgi:hypothetical protein